MLLTITAFTIFILFLPFIYYASRPAEGVRRMQARFAMLQTGGTAGLSPGTQTELVKSAEQEPTGWKTAAINGLATRLQVDKLLLEANSQQTPWDLLRLSAVITFGTMLLLFFATRNPLFILLPGASFGCCPWLLLQLRARQRLAAMNKALPQVLDMMARALRAGHSLPAAIGIVAEEAAEPARSAFTEVFQKQKFGLPLRDALMELVQGFPSNDLKVLVTAVLVQRDTGGNLVQILERTSSVIRERLKLQGDIRVHTAQGRLTGWILCLLPVLMLFLLLMTNPSYPKVLLDDPFGRKLLYGSALLLGIGAYLIQRIVKSIEA